MHKNEWRIRNEGKLTLDNYFRLNIFFLMFFLFIYQSYFVSLHSKYFVGI